MVTALYRRYRPDTFADMIGQSHVTAPLMAALKNNRVNHAYLFSGPRGCGKTSSARILARCLNCAEGPTDTPCGVCASCVELSRDGGGSLDVVEIDAASHGGIDDARELRERAIFAPARDRYKIFIIDEAHMVSPAGFNALLKIVEEPPEHVKFVFATTEPEKVIGTIRSRTHHYPFRLIPPGQLLDYVQDLCEKEGVQVAPGVLPLVVRAGGGSARDTLSLLDQLIAGSENGVVEYERAVGLLGFTHGDLLDEVVVALGGQDAHAAFEAVDKVIQTGQDPRRFVEDLLERLRDLIVVNASSPAGAAAIFRGVPEDELQRMFDQAQAFGAAELSHTADIVSTALNRMTGVTAPKLQLELMIARALVPSGSDAAIARVERLERRLGVAGGSGPDAVAAPAPTSTPAPTASQPTPAAPEARPVAEESASPPAAVTQPEPSIASTQPEPVATSAAPVGQVTVQLMKDSWQQILDALMKTDRRAWMTAFTATVRDLQDDVLTLSFTSQADAANFKQGGAGTNSVSEQLRKAIESVLGIRVRFIAKVQQPGKAPDVIVETGVVEPLPAEAAASATGAPISEEPPLEEPPAEFEPPADESFAQQIPAVDEPATATLAESAAPAPAPEFTRYGEAVVREVLGATFVEEQPLPGDQP